MSQPPFDYSSPPSQPTPLSPQQVAEMETARRAMKPIRRAVFFALTDGWSLAVFAVLTLICGFSSVSAIAVGAGLGIVAYIELSNIPKLKALNPAAAKTLAYNQLGLAGVLIVYALYNLLVPTPLSSELQSAMPELKSASGNIDLARMDAMLNHVIYFALIAVAVFAQGSLALFYYRRIKSVHDYIANTPAWIIQMQQAGFGL